MGRNNYSKFFKNTENEEKIPEVMEEQISIEEVVNVDNDPHVVSEELEQAVINAGGEVMRVEEIEETEEINEEVNEEVENTIQTASGVVTGCAKLNVREEPSKDSKVLCIINELSAVVVTITESTEDFYKICTPSGVEGYCMKKFINVI